MSVSINGTNGLTFNDGSTQTTSPFVGGFAMRNRIINGDMRIDQRNNGASVTPAANQYLVDRWQVDVSQTSKFTAQQSTVAPAGFSNSLLITSSSAYSVLTGDYFYLRYKIEGFNFADFAFGTANAATVTLSFWVRSSLTGTFAGSLRNNAANRSYPFNYTINAANTWEQKSVTIAGDTTGTWVGATNGVGVDIAFNIGTGSTYSGTADSWAGSNLVSTTGATSVVGTNGATFYITGVQLEKGSTATEFDRRPYGTELQLCQRYYEVLGEGSNGSLFIQGVATTVQGIVHTLPFKVTKRATPTVTKVGTWSVSNSAQPYIATSGINEFSLGVNSSAAGQFGTNNNAAGAYVTAVSEL